MNKVLCLGLLAALSSLSSSAFASVMTYPNELTCKLSTSGASSNEKITLSRDEEFGQLNIKAGSFEATVVTQNGMIAMASLLETETASLAGTGHLSGPHAIGTQMGSVSLSLKGGNKVGILSCQIIVLE